MKNSILTLLFIHFVFSGFAQNFSYEVRGTYQRPIVKEKLNVAKTMSDINPGFPSSWISGYVSVELLATCNGIVQKAFSKNDVLSTEQRGILKNADTGTDIVVNVKYNLKNSTATDGEVRLINFSYTVIPEIEAVYPGGDPVLKAYLKKNAIDKIAEPVANALKLTTVRFTINEEGQVTNARITTTSEDAKIDNLLLETINKMPKWKPAENAQGIKVKQEFEFRVGNSFGC